MGAVRGGGARLAGGSRVGLASAGMLARGGPMSQRTRVRCGGRANKTRRAGRASPRRSPSEAGTTAGAAGGAGAVTYGRASRGRGAVGKRDSGSGEEGVAPASDGMQTSCGLGSKPGQPAQQRTSISCVRALVPQSGICPLPAPSMMASALHRSYMSRLPNARPQWLLFFLSLSPSHLHHAPMIHCRSVPIRHRISTAPPTLPLSL